MEKQKIQNKLPSDKKVPIKNNGDSNLKKNWIENGLDYL